MWAEAIRGHFIFGCYTYMALTLRQVTCKSEIPKRSRTIHMQGQLDLEERKAKKKNGKLSLHTASCS